MAVTSISFASLIAQVFGFSFAKFSISENFPTIAKHHIAQVAFLVAWVIVFKFGTVLKD
jgi:hypothetical protein